jgi:hypothetical protein
MPSLSGIHEVYSVLMHRSSRPDASYIYSFLSVFVAPDSGAPPSLCSEIVDGEVHRICVTDCQFLHLIGRLSPGSLT